MHTSEINNFTFAVLPFIIVMNVVFGSLNPTTQFQVANNTKRQADVNAILNAVDQYLADNNGIIPPIISTKEKEIASGITYADLCTLLVPTYLATLPTDPDFPSQTTSSCPKIYDSGYTIKTDGTTITVRAPKSHTKIISVTR